jgi:hypothetical protein
MTFLMIFIEIIVDRIVGVFLFILKGHLILIDQDVMM